MLTDTVVPTIVLTCESVPADLRGRWTDAGAEVVLTGDESVDLAVAVSALGTAGCAGSTAWAALRCSAAWPRRAWSTSCG